MFYEYLVCGISSKERQLRVSLIIPALNEAGSIGSLLDEVPAGLVDEIIVVDNGSTDDTAAAAQAAGARVVTEVRRGYGSACAAGVGAASGDLLVFMDGDGSFVPSQITGLVEPIRAGVADLVLGTRMLGGMAPGAMPAHQLFGNRLVARLLRTIYGLPLSDLGPFRAIRRHQLLALGMQELTYGWPVEMMVKSARQGLRIIEVPVSYRPRSAGQSKVGGTVRGTLLAAYRILRVTARHAFG